MLEGICHAYRKGGAVQRVLHEVSLSIRRGQSCAIVGPSGSGKSTLLNILGLLDQPSSGRFLLDGIDMSQATADERAIVRNKHIGFVFQSHNLLPRMNALDNVALPLLYRGHTRADARQRALHQLERVGLGGHLARRPCELSGGQRQRVAIARALAGEPALILADEPTGNLDSASARHIMDLQLQLNRQEGVTLVMVTHDDGLAQCLERCVRVEDGRIVETPRQRAESHA